MGTKNKQTGFTLIELMIVIAIIGIIAAIGFPVYTAQLAKSRRGDGQGALLALANAMERHASRNPTTGYADRPGVDPCVTDPGNAIAPPACIFPHQTTPLGGETVNYNLTLNVTTNAAGFGNGYTLSAIPQNKQAGDDCGTMTITNLGIKAPASTASLKCWK